MVASPYLLKSMGLPFSREILYNNPTPEEQMWRAVIINAIEEAMILPSDRKSSLIKMNSHNWILSKCQDFKNVCDWANVNSTEIYRSYRTACYRRIVVFKEKHVAWKKYDIIYKKMMQEPNSSVRLRIKRKILLYRRSIIDSKDTFLSFVLINPINSGSLPKCSKSLPECDNFFPFSQNSTI